MSHATVNRTFPINDDDVREMALRFDRERKTKRVLTVGVLLAVLAAGLTGTLLTYSSL